jgi:hypothetical protein
VNDAFGTTSWLFQDVSDVTFIVIHRVVQKRTNAKSKYFELGNQGIRHIKNCMSATFHTSSTHHFDFMGESVSIV